MTARIKLMYPDREAMIRILPAVATSLVAGVVGVIGIAMDVNGAYMVMASLWAGKTTIDLWFGWLRRRDEAKR